MLLYRMNRLRAVGGGMVLRYCEGRFGVTRREWVMLALLHNSEAVQASELAARANLTKSATSKAITALAARGLIQRGSRPGDRRYAEISLSAEGKALYRGILPLVQEINARLMAELSPQDIDRLDAMLASMEAQAEQMRHHLADLPRADRRHGGSRKIREVRP
jgi:DNA-binding MarR family transcriptional regulator